MKLWPFSALFERKSLDNPTDDDFLILAGGVPGTTSLATALTVPAVTSAVRVISEAIASLDVYVAKIGDDGTETRDAAHPVAKLLAAEPNAWSSWFDFHRDMIAGALTTDRGAVGWVNRIGGEIREVTRFEPAHTTVDFSSDGRMEPSFQINNRAIPAEDIVYLRSPFSRSPLSLASDAIAAAKAMETHAKRLFENGAKPSGVLKSPKAIGDEAAKKMAAAFKAAFLGVDNAGKVPLLWDGMEFDALTLNSVDAQFLELRKFQIIEIARAFRVPPSMLFELDRATWSNSEQMGKEFLVYCIQPWIKAYEGALRRSLFSDGERKNYAVRFDTDDLTQADLTARATAISSLISSRVISPNIALSWLGLPPRAGGDVYENPNTGSNQPGAAAPQGGN